MFCSIPQYRSIRSKKGSDHSKPTSLRVHSSWLDSAPENLVWPLLCCFTAIQSSVWFLTWPAGRRGPSRRSRTASTTNDYQLTSSFHWTDRQTDIFIQRTMSWVTVFSVRAHGGTMWAAADASYSWTAGLKRKMGSWRSFYYFNSFFPAWWLMGRQRTQVCVQAEWARIYNVAYLISCRFFKARKYLSSVGFILKSCYLEVSLPCSEGVHVKCLGLDSGKMTLAVFLAYDSPFSRRNSRNEI